MNSRHPAPQRGRLLTTLAVVAVAVTCIGASTAADGDGQTMSIIATMDDASPLLPGNDVRVGGVHVGKIADIGIVAGGARLVIELDPEALPVYKDATVTSRPVSLLGERYVDLDRGTPEAGTLSSGGRIAESNARSGTDLDEVLDTLDEPTSRSLAMLVTTLGTGADGNGKNIDESVKALLPAMENADQLAEVLKDQNSTLNSLVDSFEPVAQGLAADEGKSLDRLIGASKKALDATAVEEKAFRDLMDQLPGTLVSARTTLAELEGTADAAVPLLDDLRPTTQDLSKISRELIDFADSADPALRAANPVLEKAEALLEEARPVAEQLRLQGPAMKASVNGLDPVTDKLAGDFTSVMEFFRGWALATNSRDGLSHYFRAGLVVTTDSVTGLLPNLSGQPDSENRVPAGPAAPSRAEDTAAKGEDDPLGAGQLPGLLSPKTSKDGGVTGMTSKQERGALSFLLGGL